MPFFLKLQIYTGYYLVNKEFSVHLSLERNFNIKKQTLERKKRYTLDVLC